MTLEEQFYQLALDEIVQKRVVPATFAKAFALSDGDENRTRAGYIRIRDPNGVRSWGLGLTGGPDGERGI